MWQNGGASPSHFLITPFNFNISTSDYRQTSATFALINKYILSYHHYDIPLVRSNSPCTLRLRRSACVLRSQTWYVGVFFLGTHTFPPPWPVFVVERSTTRGVEENLMTSLYNVFVSVAKDRTEGTLYLDSVSESSVSDKPEVSNGGVGSRCLVSGSGGSSSISRMRSLPFK
jgi:hypothetical protein